VCLNPRVGRRSEGVPNRIAVVAGGWIIRACCGHGSVYQVGEGQVPDYGGIVEVVVCRGDTTLEVVAVDNVAINGDLHIIKSPALIPDILKTHSREVELNGADRVGEGKTQVID